jgi:hypothetical protein
MPLSLGAVLGGPEKTVAIQTFRTLSQQFPKGGIPFLNVVFHFPGTLITPNYSGLRTGRFSNKEQGFMIQAAVPVSIAESEQPNEIIDYFDQTIREAMALSRERWNHHKIEFPWDADFATIESCVLQCRAKLGEPSDAPKSRNRAF